MTVQPPVAKNIPARMARRATALLGSNNGTFAEELTVVALAACGGATACTPATVATAVQATQDNVSKSDAPPQATHKQRAAADDPVGVDAADVTTKP